MPKFDVLLNFFKWDDQDCVLNRLSCIYLVQNTYRFFLHFYHITVSSTETKGNLLFPRTYILFFLFLNPSSMLISKIILAIVSVYFFCAENLASLFWCRYMLPEIRFTPHFRAPVSISLFYNTPLFADLYYLLVWVRIVENINNEISFRFWNDIKCHKLTIMFDS